MGSAKQILWGSPGKVVQKWLRLLFLFALSLILSLSGCEILQFTPNSGPLPAVESLPLPQLPDWIEEISPTAEAENLAQIRIRFQEPLIPLERLDSPRQQKILNKFALTPSLPGKFRFLTPRMVGFQAEEAIPLATRVRVTLEAGLEDLENHRLEEDLAWTFQTQALKLANLPGVYGEKQEDDVEPFSTEPTFQVTSNLELDLSSAQDHVSLKPERGNGSVALEITPVEEENASELPKKQFAPGQKNRIYNLKPKQELAKDTKYRLEFTPGISPQRGNLPSEVTFASEIKTYPPLEFKQLEFVGKPAAGGAYRRFVKGGAQLQFNNGLVADSALNQIKLQPSPKKGLPAVRSYEGWNVIEINPWALEPDTDYKITIGGELKDKFGQTLGKSVTVDYNPGDVAANFWAPSGLNIFPADQDLQLNISAVNLAQPEYEAAYRVVQPTDLVFAESAYPGDYSLLFPGASWQKFTFEQQEKNKSQDIAIPLRERLGKTTGMLAYGLKTRTHRYQQKGEQKWYESSHYGLVQLTNLGIFTQWFPESGLIRVHHLSDGAAVANAAVELYQSQLNTQARTQVQPCARGNTDRTGTLIISDQGWQQCLAQQKSDSEDAGPELLVIAREGEDWAFTRTFAYSGSYDYGLDAGWDRGKAQSRGTIFSDRKLYQPGEKAWFTAAAYYLQDGGLQQDKNAAYQVILKDPNGKTKDLGNQTTNQFGTFSVELDLEPDQALGFYSLEAKREGVPDITGEFRVAEFNPPNFKVELNLDEKFALVNQEISAQVQSEYLFGAPVQGGNIKYYVTRDRAYFTPEGWQEFQFGRQWLWPEESPEIPSDVLQTQKSLDNQGKSEQNIKVAADLPYPMTYRVDAQVSDVSNLSVSNSQTFIALPSQRLIGLRSDFVADAEKPFPVEVIVSDPQGKTLSGERVRVELQKINYTDVTQVVEGSLRPRNQVQYETVAEATIRSGKQPKTVSLTPPESGSYRLRANFVGAENEVSATDSQIWATGPTPAYWGARYRNNRLDLKLDKSKYAPGDVATVLIQSPYEEAELYFAIIRHDTIYSEIRQVQGGAPEIKFTVTEDMLPNAAVQAVLVRRGKPLKELEPGSIDKLVRIGFAPFNTAVDDKYLQVQVKPESAKQEPGREQTLNLTLKDEQNQPVSGQFTVMVVNEAILQLTGYRPPDLVKQVYAQQPIATRFADNRTQVVLESPSSPLEKGWGYGGGASAAGANTRTRTDFRALAYYNGSVLSNDQGEARVSFNLPDDLTTWRVMVVATDGNLRFGQGDSTFMTTKPLMANPLLPQFVRPGDRFEAGLAITNTTEQQGDINIAGALSQGLEFADSSSKQSLNFDTKTASGTRGYRFGMVAKERIIGDEPQQGTVQFETRLKDLADVFEVPLVIKSSQVTEQIIASGTTETQAKIPLNVERRQVLPNAGGLDINLASTLIPEITAPAEQLLAEDYLPFLETTASQLLIAANLQLLEQHYGQAFADFSPLQKATEALAQLAKLQQDDGGFASWSGYKRSSPYLTPYAAQAIAQASAAGIPVDSEVTDSLKNYLAKILANPGQYDYCNNTTCKNRVRLESLMALAELGDKRDDFLTSLYEQRAQFDLVEQIKLARYLSLFEDWQPESGDIAQQIQETIYQTGRSAQINLPANWRWLSSTTVAQSQALRLFVSQNANPETLSRLVQGLLDQRRNGTWHNRYDNAQALAALVDYTELEPTPPNFIANVQLGNQQLGKARFEGNLAPNFELQIPMQELPPGENDLLLSKSGEGKLHYLTAYRYRLRSNQPGRFNGLRITRSVRQAKQTEVLRQMDLSATDKPWKIDTGEVFDIGLEIITDHPVDRVVISDYLPAGLEAVDTSFDTSTEYFQPHQDSWQIDFQNIYRDRIVAYGDRLDAGVYSLHYLARSVTPGKFLWPGAEVHLQYAPEEFGRCSASTLEVK